MLHIARRTNSMRNYTRCATCINICCSVSLCDPRLSNPLRSAVFRISLRLLDPICRNDHLIYSVWTATQDSNGFRETHKPLYTAEVCRNGRLRLPPPPQRRKAAIKHVFLGAQTNTNRGMKRSPRTTKHHPRLTHVTLWAACCGQSSSLTTPFNRDTCPVFMIVHFAIPFVLWAIIYPTTYHIRQKTRKIISFLKHPAFRGVKIKIGK